MTILVPHAMPDRGWSDPLSFIAQGVDENNQIRYQGRYFHNGAEFRFTINQQVSGKYLMRGRVSAVSPVDGKILQVIGAEKRERLKRSSESSDVTAPEDSTVSEKRQKILNITTEIYCNSTEETVIKDSIYDGVMRLYCEYADLIHHRMKQSSRPEHIVPSVAAVLYCDEFLATNYKGCSDSTFNSYSKGIKEHYANFPNVPMHKVTKKQMEAYLIASATGVHTQKLLAKFWRYCVEKGICLDSNPFPSLPKRKLSTEAKHKKAVTPEELSLDMQDALYEYLKSNINSPNCGIVLQPWGGFSAKDACSLLWKDVEFDPIRKGFARIKFRRDDLAGATHDFTRPIFPQAAILLRLRYEQLLCDYPPEVLSLFPVVSTKTNPQKAMTPDALTQYAGMILRAIGISETVFASLKSPKEAVSKKLLINTYIKNVMLRSNLTDDPGTASFLFGESLRSSTTDDHYSSFVSPDAAERIHTAMKAITPVEPFPAPISKTVTKDGSEEHTYHPETTRQSVGVVCDIVLQPSEKLDVLCPHGVIGSIRAREITESGIKRKSVSRKNLKSL